MKKEFQYIYLILGTCLISISLMFHATTQIGLHYDNYIILIMLSLIGLTPYLYQNHNNHQLSPARLYAFSIIIFILSRPIIHIFSSVDLVEVGNGINDHNIFKSLLIILLFIWTSGIGFVCANVIKKNNNIFDPFNYKVLLRVEIPSAIKGLILILFISSGFIFIAKSIYAASSMSGVDYLTVIDDPNFHKHLFWFFLCKNIGLLWVLTTKSEKNAMRYVKFLLFFSIGFLIIGLRGYFVIYLFCFIYFRYENRRLNGFTIAIISLIILYSSSWILEYRLGYDVFSDLQSMILMPFYQQGATFEVIFGTTVFTESLRQCISIFDYITGDVRFGDCVDKVRGVPFDNGGFASSVVAESIYLGTIPVLILSFIIGLFVSFLNRLSLISKQSKNVFLAKVILLSCLPNLIYIGRSSAFDFIFKIVSTLIVITFFFRLLKKQAMKKLVSPELHQTQKEQNN